MHHLEHFLKSLGAFIDGPWFKLFLGAISAGSLYFGYRQLGLRKADERRRKAEDHDRREQERASPVVCNLSGRAGPILIGGYDETPTASRYWGNVTIINPTNRPMRIGAIKLLLDGIEIDLTKDRAFEFCLLPNSYYKGIAMRPGDKVDYQLVFRFPTNTKLCGRGELWLESDNRLEGFAIPIEFRRV
jgi:hypothetical protein